MKSLYTFLAILLATQFSYAQTNISWIVGPQVDTSFAVSVQSVDNVKFKFESLSRNISQYDWSVTTLNLPDPNWEFQVCDDDNCIIATSTTVDMYQGVNQNDTVTFKMNCYTDGIMGMGRMDVALAANGVAIDTMVFICRNDGSSTEIFAATANSVEMFPNPANGQVTFSAQDITMKEIAIFNVNGQLVRQQQFEAESFYTMNVEDMTKGMYIVKIKDNKDQIRVQKLMLR